MVHKPRPMEVVDRHLSNRAADTSDPLSRPLDCGSLVIGIPTFRRPESLRRTLDSLARLKTARQISVLVADNDDQQREGVQLVQEMAPNYRWPIEAIIEPQRGISHVRNAILSRGMRDQNQQYLLMIDDDQWVESDWLDQMLAMTSETGADVVGNRVVADFPGTVPKWATGQYVYALPERAGGRCETIHGTGGVLLSRAAIEMAGAPAFDPSYGLTGGGDSEFFARIKKRGATFAYADRAVIHEVYEPAQMTKRWALRRAFRIGSGDLRIKWTHADNWTTRMTELAKPLAAIPIGWCRWLLAAGNARKQMHARLLVARNCGKLAGILKYRPQEYRNPLKKA